MSNKDLMNVNGESTRPYNVDNLPSTFGEMNEWMTNWNRWFDNFFNRFFDTPTLNSATSLLPRTWQAGMPFGSGSFVPAVNVSESDKEFLVTAELPGVTEQDIDLSVDNDTLTIKGEKHQDHEEKGAGWNRVERTYGSFQRTIPLSREVDTNKIEAAFKQGVLTIHLPKLPDVQTNRKKIEIKTDTSS